LKAVQMGLSDDEDPDDRTFNQTPQDMLRCVPGVDGKVLGRLVLETGSLLEVTNMGIEELGEIVGRESGRQIVRFFGKNIFE